MWCGCDEAWTESEPSLLSAAQTEAAQLDRRQALRAMAGTVLLATTGCGATISSAHREEAQRLAQESMSVDLHSHPGMIRTSGISLDRHLERIARGKLKAALFCAVADGPVIGRRPQGGLYARRELNPGESYVYTYSSLAAVRSWAAQGKLVVIQTAADLEVARVQGRPGAILAVEGGDFLEGRIERVQEAQERGIRSIQLTHYRINELGDIQTEPPRHGGLTRFGEDVIREMNRLGMVVDVAHLTYDGVRRAVVVSQKPVILSHTVLSTSFARSVSKEHAELVAKRGGVIGIFPVNSGYHGFSGYIEHISRMIAAVGVDHVGIGTDMDGISPPSFVALDDYSEWPSIVAALLARGYSREDVTKVAGGNFLRVFREVAAT